MGVLGAELHVSALLLTISCKSEGNARVSISSLATLGLCAACPKFVIDRAQCGFCPVVAGPRSEGPPPGTRKTELHLEIGSSRSELRNSDTALMTGKGAHRAIFVGRDPQGALP